MAGETIGFVGTGRMGGPMAGRLMDAGYSLCVYDTQSEATKPLVARGARLANSPAEGASSADIVLASLPTPDIVKAVTLGPGGLIAGNRASIVIDLSTSGPGAAKQIAEGFKPRNITLVDAPVSGGIKGAVNGTLAVMVSCPKATFDRVEPILKHFGKLLAFFGLQILNQDNFFTRLIHHAFDLCHTAKAFWFFPHIEHWQVQTF